MQQIVPQFEGHLVATIAPTKRGLKESICSGDSDSTPVATIAPTKRGLKVRHLHAVILDSLVATIAPTKRGLKVFMV